MRSSESKFTNWVNSMYQDNCVERRDWMQPALTFDEYFTKNEQWLREQFKEYCFKRGEAREAWIKTVVESSI